MGCGPLRRLWVGLHDRQPQSYSNDPLLSAPHPALRATFPAHAEKDARDEIDLCESHRSLTASGALRDDPQDARLPTGYGARFKPDAPRFRRASAPSRDGGAP